MGASKTTISKAVSNQACLILVCPEQLGVIAALDSFFAERNINLSTCVKFTVEGNLFARVEWSLNDQWEDDSEFSEEFTALANHFSAYFDVHFSSKQQSVGLFVGAETHCFIEFINRNVLQKEATINIPFIIGSDEKVRNIADRYGLPFFHIDVDQSSVESVQAYEKKQLDIINRYKPDFLGFTNYDTILSPELIHLIDCPMIKVQRTFMPNFDGRNAVSLAYQHGVKLVGATAFYMSSKVAYGPIIEQDMAKLKDDYSLAGLIEKSCQIEQAVFVEAMSKVLEHKTIIYNKKAISF